MTESLYASKFAVIDLAQIGLIGNFPLGEILYHSNLLEGRRSLERQFRSHIHDRFGISFRGRD